MVIAVVVLAGLLGASLLAIALLAYGWRKNRADIKKNREDINRLHAETVAAKIAALSFEDLPLVEEPPAPTRRKKHLALYIGGGVAAFLASTGERVSGLLRKHRTAAVTVGVTTAAAATGAVLYLAPTGNDTSARPDAVPPASATGAPGRDNDAKDVSAETDGLESGVYVTEQEGVTPAPGAAATGSPAPNVETMDHRLSEAAKPSQPETGLIPGPGRVDHSTPPIDVDAPAPSAPPGPSVTPTPTAPPLPSVPPVPSTPPAPSVPAPEPTRDCDIALLGICIRL